MKEMIKIVLLAFSVGFILGCATSDIIPNRWYSQEQVAIGIPLYAKYCAGCHGDNGQGGESWDRPNKDGSYPPQPLNGSGHSWHHSRTSLEKTITQGGTHSGATMPGFTDVLDGQQRQAVIAAFQDFWDDKTYSGWLRRGGL